MAVQQAGRLAVPRAAAHRPLRLACPADITGQVQAEDAVGVDEGLELGTFRHIGVEDQIMQQAER